jgi:hypothetical protein
VPVGVDDAPLAQPVWVVGHGEHAARPGCNSLCRDAVRVIHVQRDSDRGGTDGLWTWRVEVGGLGGQSDTVAGDREQCNLRSVGGPYALTGLRGPNACV